jgi:hypothetical protein
VAPTPSFPTPSFPTPSFPTPSFPPTGNCASCGGGSGSGCIDIKGNGEEGCL